MKIYIIRHGQTKWNKLGKIQGRTDNELNKTGREQAKQIANFFKDTQIDLVISSSLSRAIVTATIAIKQPMIIDDSFIERDFGIYEGMMIEQFLAIEEDMRDCSFESDEHIIKRVSSGVNSYKDENINSLAIFAHSHVLKAFLIYLDNQKYSFYDEIKNCAILVIDYSNNKMTLDGIF